MEDEDIAWGNPSLQEYREYFSNPCLNIEEHEVMDANSSFGSTDLSDSFKVLLDQKRRQELCTPVASQNILDKTLSPFVGTLEESVLEMSDWWPSDETFARMEIMCENSQETAALERFLADVSEEIKLDVTQIHEIEAPSFVWEQTVEPRDCGNFLEFPSSGVDASNDTSEEKEVMKGKEANDSPQFNDTMECMDFMLVQAQKLQEEHVVTPKFDYTKTPVIQRYQSLRDPRLIDEVHEQERRHTQLFVEAANKVELPQLATYDDRTRQKVPDGGKIRSLIGETKPGVAKHEGWLEMNEKRVELDAANNTIDGVSDL